MAPVLRRIRRQDPREAIFTPQAAQGRFAQSLRIPIGSSHRSGVRRTGLAKTEIARPDTASMTLQTTSCPSQVDVGFHNDKSLWCQQEWHQYSGSTLVVHMTHCTWCGWPLGLLSSLTRTRGPHGTRRRTRQAARIG
jgi:hypothetical protein